MTKPQKSQFKLDMLLSDLLDGTISEENFDALDQHLRSDPHLLEKYYEHLTLVHGLRKYSRRTAPVMEDTTDRSELAEYCSFQEVVEKDLDESAIRRAIKAIEKEKQRSHDVFPHKPVHNRRIPTQREMISAIVKIAAVIALATSMIWLDRQLWKRVGEPTTVQPTQPLPTVALVTDLMGTLSMEDLPTACQTGDRLCPKAFALDPFGFVALTFDNGAKVILEGPAHFELVDAKTMVLKKGKLFAQVSERASGFTVKGPAANVVDLGTEFGLQTDSDGTSRVYTYKGKVSVTGYCQGQSVESRIITAGQAQKVVGRNGAIGKIPFEPERFARQIDSNRRFVWRGQPLDLADIIGKGNGFGDGRSDMSIRMEDGTFRHYWHSRNRRGAYAGRFVEVSESPYIDGIFVPDGRVDPMIVSSLGHRFSACPQTSGEFFEDIFNGSYTGRAPQEAVDNHYKHYLILEGQPYGTPDHPAITVHSNTGITFDLNAIRTGCRPVFQRSWLTARCGISEEAELRDGNTADFWVLVDGETRFHAADMQRGMTSKKIRIELKPEDRFLSLVCTEGKNGPSMDWGIFAEPRLEAIGP